MCHGVVVGQAGILLACTLPQLKGAVTSQAQVGVDKGEARMMLAVAGPQHVYQPLHAVLGSFG